VGVVGIVFFGVGLRLRCRKWWGGKIKGSGVCVLPIVSNKIMLSALVCVFVCEVYDEHK
jgi:hypothetical protein